MRKSISKAPMDEYLNLSGRELRDTNLEFLIDEYPNLEVLNISNNYISNEGAKIIASSNTIRDLYISNNKIGNLGAKFLAQNKSIKLLQLEDNNVGDEGARYLAQNNTIETLILRRNRLTSVGIQSFVNNKSIKALQLGYNPQIDDEAAKVLARNTTLKSLELNGGNIGPAGAKALARNNTLRGMWLNKNNVGDAGALAFSRNNFLNTLHLGRNGITDAGAKQLAKNNSVTYLDLGYNEIGNEGVVALAKNKTLKFLNIVGNIFNDDAIRAFLNNRTLIQLHYVMNSFESRIYYEIQNHIDENKYYYEHAAGIIHKKGTYKRKDIPEPIESTEWMGICRNPGIQRMDDLKNIARQVGIKPNGKTKRELCAELALHFESLQSTKPHKSGCHNEDDILGDPFDEMNPKLYQSYEFETRGGKVKYCFSLADLAGLAPDFKDPFTREPLPRHIVDWYYKNKDLHQVHELKTTKRGTRRDQAMFITDILDKQERRLAPGRFEFIPDTTKYFQVAPLLADKLVIDEYRRVLKNQELIQDLGFQRKFIVGESIDEYYTTILDTLKETRENYFDNLETLKWVYVEVMNDVYNSM